MEIAEIIAIVSIVLFYSGLLIGLWVKINVKLKELEIMIINNKQTFNDHVSWGENENDKNREKITNLSNDNKEEHKEMIKTMNLILSKLTDFQIDIVGKCAYYHDKDK